MLTRRARARAAYWVLLGAMLPAFLCAPARADRASKALAKYEGPIDTAIDKALAYLARRQQADGAISDSGSNPAAVTSLAVMAFLAKGHTPGAGPYGKVIDRGIDYVLTCQQATGLIAHAGNSRGPMYSHGIATLMLSEASGMLDSARQAKVDGALSKALKLILAAQRVPKSQMHRGGWRYQHTSTDSDISCSSWSIMALRSARNNGAPIPKQAIDAGVQYIQRCRHAGGGFCYQPGGSPGVARTGTALLCLELCGHHRSAAALGAGDYLLAAIGAAGKENDKYAEMAKKQNQQYDKLLAASRKRIEDAKKRGDPASRVAAAETRLAQMVARRTQSVERRAASARRRAGMRFGGSHFYYGVYYCAQGMFQLGGTHWEQFAAPLYEILLKVQAPDGSWPQRGAAGPTYATAMSVLALSVTYRQLPIYQR